MTDTATVTPITAPTPDPKLEAWLASHHVAWTWAPDLELDRIDMRKSLANQARVDEPLIADAVELYTLAYRDGADFPPLICRQTSARARLVILDGNHRATAAAQAGRNRHPAYIVDCTDEAALLLMYEGNLHNGLQLPKKQRVAQGAHLVALGWTLVAAARAVGVQEMEISVHQTLMRGAARARDLDVARWDDLPQAARVTLARITSDPVFQQAAKLAVQAGMTGPEATALAAKVKAARSESDAMVIIGGELEERAEAIQRRFAGKTGHRRPKTTPYTSVTAACAGLVGVRPADVDETAPTADARARLRQQLKAAARACMEIERGLR